MEYTAKVNAEGKAYVILEGKLKKYIGWDTNFIPSIEIDSGQIDNKSYVRTYAGFEILWLSCKPKIELSELLDSRFQTLDAIRFLDKDEIIVRFKIKQGNSEATDNDGKIIIKPNGVNVITKKEIEIKYNQAIALRINNKNLKNNAYIDFYASDNGGGKQDVFCGRVMVLSNSLDKDVFNKTAVKRLLDDYNASRIFNKSGRVIGNGYCILSADKGIGALLNDTTNFYSEPNYKSLGGNGVRLENLTKRIQVVKSLGYVQSEFTIKTNNYNTNNRPTKLEVSLKEKIESDIEGKLGYHVYYYCMHGEYHVMTLLVDNQHPCNIIYHLLDQGYINEEDLPFKDIDDKFLSLAQKFWTNKNRNAKIIQMYKIKKI